MAPRLRSELEDSEIDLCRMAEEWASEIDDRGHEIECRVRETEAIARRPADHHPDPEARRLDRERVERAAGRQKGRS